jgi:hypothetical protein
MADDMDIAGGRVPVPDPTRLTTAALDREAAHLKELLTALLKADVQALRAAEVQHRRSHEYEDALRTTQHQALEGQIATLKELLKEALMARDHALAAALASAKEATTKAEDATTKQLDALKLNFDVEIKGLRDLIDDVKVNANSGAVQAGAAGGRIAGKEYAWGVTLVVIALLISVIGIIIVN